LWLSTSGSRTAMHFDPWPSILVQFQGLKHVVVAPPGDVSAAPGAPFAGYPYTRGGHLFVDPPPISSSSSSSSSGGSSTSTSSGSRSSGSSDGHAAPLSKPVPDSVLSCTLAPGEMVYIPPGEERQSRFVGVCVWVLLTLIPTTHHHHHQNYHYNPPPPPHHLITIPTIPIIRLVA
jgi:hypothetical protein